MLEPISGLLTGQSALHRADRAFFRDYILQYSISVVSRRSDKSFNFFATYCVQCNVHVTLAECISMCFFMFSKY
jgi:hypothetical protein